MREDLLSKRMFLAGLCGLPWLWIVHVLYYHGRAQEDDRENVLDQPEGANSQDGNDATDATTTVAEDYMSPADIELEQRKWVKRSRNAAVLVVAVWISWIAVFQALRGYFPASWYVRPPDDSAFTGW